MRSLGSLVNLLPQFFVARRERAPLIFYRDEMDLRDLPNSWSMQCTEHTTARDALAHIAAQFDSDVTRGGAPHLYWQAVGGGADDTLHSLDADTLLTDFVTGNEREKRRIRLVVNFEFPRRTISPQARSKASQLIGESPDVIRANNGTVVSPPPGGVQLLRSLSSTLLRNKSNGSPSLVKAASTDDAVAPDGAEVRGALVFASTSLTTSERECWRCHTWLAGDVVSAAGRHFHTACFQCDECHASLLASLRFSYDEQSDRRLCHICFAKRPVMPAVVPVVVVPAAVQPVVAAASPAVAQPASPPQPDPVPVTRVRQQQLGMHRTSFTLKSDVSVVDAKVIEAAKIEQQ
jgi:hypothetical protein